MKINEIIVEARGQLRKAAQLATPDMESWPALDNNNNPYLAYRFGVALAGSPDQTMDQEAAIGSQLTTIGYTEADRKITAAAAKVMGVKSRKQSSKGSTELPKVNKTSPVATKKKNKYGV